MKLQRFALALAGAGLFAVTAVSGPAAAAEPWPSLADKIAKAKQQSTSTSAAEACISSVGWANSDATVAWADAIASRPPEAVTNEPFNFAAVRNSATWYLAQGNAGTYVYFYGLFLWGGNLYRHSTIMPANGAPRPTVTRVGSGWTSFKSISTSNAAFTTPKHSYLYGLNTNGSLYRYQRVGTGFRALGSFGGFRTFKAMTVISETATYDTLLMTTNAGALYTIRIPVTAIAKPVVKLIRSTGWSAYESLAVEGCGARGGSLLVAVDHETDSGDHYAMSKANGTATVITPYGKIPAVFTGNTHMAFTTHYDQLVGE